MVTRPGARVLPRMSACVRSDPDQAAGGKNPISSRTRPSKRWPAVPGQCSSRTLYRPSILAALQSPDAPSS